MEQSWHPSPAQVDRLEKIQRKGVKWILNERDHHYNSQEYLARLRDLDILPISCRLTLIDVLMLFDIVKGVSSVLLPEYIVKFQHNDPEFSRLRTSHFDVDCYKCIVPVNCLVFQNNFFNRTINSWNRLPRDIRCIHERSVFKSAVVTFLWNQELHDLSDD